ncbi:hypothetical protein SLS53_008558 [Cytospora paraplurivora]|uniref:ribonuclease H n=1 Tax=Cytospora paraplurivora TaxID=2898453 RepID=A0AAN9U046_9PEZI
MKGVFQPVFSLHGRGCPVQQLITYTPAVQVRQLQLLHPRTNVIELDRLTVVVSIEGACRDNGKPTACASWGVYFGPGSRHNYSGLLSPDLPQTSSRAEIEALSRAIDTIWVITDDNMSLQDIKIRCDSDYLCQAMSMWMEGWIENDGLRSNGRPVALFDKLREIQDKIDDMTYGGNGGLKFQFWHVPRAENKEADELANTALDGYRAAGRPDGRSI